MVYGVTANAVVHLLSQTGKQPYNYYGTYQVSRVAFWGVVNTANVSHTIDTPPTHLTLTRVGQRNGARNLNVGNALVMSAAAYLNSLDFPNKVAD